MNLWWGQVDQRRHALFQFSSSSAASSFSPSTYIDSVFFSSSLSAPSLFPRLSSLLSLGWASPRASMHLIRAPHFFRGLFFPFLPRASVRLFHVLLVTRHPPLNCSESYKLLSKPGEPYTMSHQREPYDSQFFHLTFPELALRCENCKKPNKAFLCKTCKTWTCNRTLLRCSNCMVVHYCSKECQQQHWSMHKDLCKKAKKALADYIDEEAKLKNFTDHIGGEPRNYFEHPDYKYRFWDLPETREFLKTTMIRVGVYNSIGTATALKLCVELTMKFLFHCRFDQCGFYAVTFVSSSTRNVSRNT